MAEDIKSGKLWKLLEIYDHEGSLISASTPGEDVWTEFGKKPGKEVTTGLVAGHAYTIIKVSHTVLFYSHMCCPAMILLLSIIISIRSSTLSTDQD